MKNKKFLVFFMSLVLILLVISACTQTQRREEYNNQNPPSQTRVIPKTPAPGKNVPGQTPYPGVRNIRDENKNYMARAEKCADKVADMKEVDSATCVITGNTAMIGVQFDEQYKGKVTNAIKKKIETVVKNQDGKLRTVVVTADPDLISRMEDILQSIGQGRPISGFAKEMNELLNRIQPK